MWPWKKKAKNNSPAPESGLYIPPCPHTWKDFPWILKSTYDSVRDDVHVVITEPYVCIHCGERKNVVLYDAHKYARNRDFANDIHDAFAEKYKDLIGDDAVVEDMINDAILVDREKLKIVEKLRGEKIHEEDPDLQSDSDDLFGNPRIVIH